MPEIRAHVWAKTKGFCWYCGEELNPWENFTVDHMDPQKNGGGDELENLTPACKRCNSRKHAKTVDEYRTYLAGKGALMFWGELPIPTEKEQALTETDEDEDYDGYTPDFYVYSRIVRDCLYIGADYKGWLDSILIACTQMIDSWSLYSSEHGWKSFKAYGHFTFDEFSKTLVIHPQTLAIKLMLLNELGIFKFHAYDVSAKKYFFTLDIMRLHDIAKHGLIKS